jgi:hypothetical protein
MGKSQISHQVLIGQSKHYENGNLSILIFSTPPFIDIISCPDLSVFGML